MELRQLEHFATVAELRHFTRAAERVHLTQSSLSASIHALERDLGTDLFVRSTRSVELTAAGAALLPAARRALAAAEDGRNAVAQVRGLLRGQLRIGAIQTLGPVDLSAAVAEFHRRHPGVRLAVRNSAVRELVRQVLDGELDLAFVDRPLGPDESRLDVRVLGDEELVLAVAAADPLARRRRIRLATLGERDFVEYRADSALRAMIDDVSARVGLRRRIVCETDTIIALTDLVAGGVGIAMLPARVLDAAPAERVVGVRTDPPVGREVLLVRAGDRPPSPAAGELLQIIGRTYPARR